MSWFNDLNAAAGIAGLGSGTIPLVIKPRRFRITLWLLDKKLNPVAELDEIVGFQCEYALNRIPTATIVPAHGLEMHTDNPSKILVNLNKMIKEKAPVGICVELIEKDTADNLLSAIHQAGGAFFQKNKDSGALNGFAVPQFATTSDTNATDPDREKWPNAKVFIFKGYVASCSMQRTGTSIRTQINLIHWLQDLTLVSMYSPRSHTSAPYQFAADMARTYMPDPEQTLGGWDLSDADKLMEVFDSVELYNDATATPKERKRTLYDCVVATVRSVIKTAKEAQDMDKCAYGQIEPIYWDKQNNALNRIISCLEYNDVSRQALIDCWEQVTASIDNTGIESWVTATVWDKLCGHYSQLYYYSLSPAAGWCYVIPSPSCIDYEEKILTLTSNELTSINYTEPTAPVLGGVVLADDSAEPENSFGSCPMFDPIVYPPQGATSEELQESVGGPLAVIKLPSYLQCTGTAKYPPTEMNQILVTDTTDLQPRPKMTEARKDALKTSEAVDILAYELVRLHFLSQVFAGRRLQVTTGFRGDIVPGACLHIHVTPVMENNAADTTIDLYGTVEYVMLTAESSGQMNTVIVLNNIRNAEEYTSNMYNPDDIPFYNEIFTGKNATLYCPFINPLDNANPPTP